MQGKIAQKQKNRAAIFVQAPDKKGGAIFPSILHNLLHNKKRKRSVATWTF
jgi:predicted aldo/keto reductase-like oxidoreductase